MITSKECLKILTKNGASYNEQESEKILDFLKNFADIALKEYYRKDGKSDFVHKGLNR
jgi:hypothetical protein